MANTSLQTYLRIAVNSFYPPPQKRNYLRTFPVGPTSEIGFSNSHSQITAENILTPQQLTSKCILFIVIPKYQCDLILPVELSSAETMVKHRSFGSHFSFSQNKNCLQPRYLESYKILQSLSKFTVYNTIGTSDITVTCSLWLILSE